MKILKIVAGILLALLLLVSGVGHLLNPELTSGLIPDMLPKTLVHTVVGIVELGLGIGVFIPRMRKRALQGIFVLMVLFVPVHVIDLFREPPVIGSDAVAIVRIIIQFVFAYLAWFAGGKPGANTEPAVISTQL